MQQKIKLLLTGLSLFDNLSFSAHPKVIISSKLTSEEKDNQKLRKERTFDNEGMDPFKTHLQMMHQFITYHFLGVDNRN